MSDQLKELAAQIEAALKQQLEKLVGDGVALIDGPIRDASIRLANAAALGRKDLVQENADILEHELAAQKYRVFGVAPSGLNSVLSFGLNLLFDGLVTKLGGLKS